MERATCEADRTAFRNAEKKYKLFKSTPKNASKQKPTQSDLSDVFDFKSILEVFDQTGETPPEVYKLQRDSDYPVFCFRHRPGFYFIPGALSIEEQCQLVKESLTSFPQPPNRTNHNATYGAINNLFNAAQDGKILIEVDNMNGNLKRERSLNDTNLSMSKWMFVESYDISARDTCKPIAAAVLLRKLRWCTLGLQFDWAKRNYDISLPHNKLPDTLCQLAKRMAAVVLPANVMFKPEAAIVNYFGSVAR